MNCCNNIPASVAACCDNTELKDGRKKLIEKLLISKHDYHKSLSYFFMLVYDDANLSIQLSPIKHKGTFEERVFLEYTHECRIKTSKYDDVVFNVAIDLR